MKLIIGIGNPGAEYENTRHNIGFLTLDKVRKSIGSSPWKKETALKSWVSCLGKETVLAKPSTYVNRSGEAAKALLKKYSLKPESLLVVCDDVNLVFGKLRLRASGSSGGHHGLESISDELETKDFPRLKFGIAGDGMPKDLSPYVLSAFSAGEKKELPDFLDHAASVCESWVKDGFSAALGCLSRLQS